MEVADLNRAPGPSPGGRVGRRRHAPFPAGAFSRGQGPHRRLLAGDGGAIRALINEACLDHGILGEEHRHERPDARFTWVIDPIDGTKAFITGMPTWGTLIALQDRGKDIIGMLDQPFLRERFVGHGEGAYEGERRLAVRSCPDLGEAVLYATQPVVRRRLLTPSNHSESTPYHADRRPIRALS